MNKQLEIKNFRSIEHLVLKDLGKLNIIVGKNSNGKLDAMLYLRKYFSWEECLLLNDVGGGLHYSEHESFCLDLIVMMESKQTFVTTESAEIIGSLVTLKNLEGHYFPFLEHVRIFRIDFIEGAHRSTSYTAKELRSTIKNGWEFR